MEEAGSREKSENVPLSENHSNLNLNFHSEVVVTPTTFCEDFKHALILAWKFFDETLFRSYINKF
ncbi:hypothetical protein DLM75_09880 [Leptospira stimsonii]|uniref:Uncharacterized protein n=1 Tax=Leptospira stimsonii TaxID=2202203 RepID=A0A396Z5C8_9LEPT|nr:hypothetical protein DLM75_09880 [Leptospira stimsonii]